MTARATEIPVPVWPIARLPVAVMATCGMGANAVTTVIRFRTTPVPTTAKWRAVAMEYAGRIFYLGRCTLRLATTATGWTETAATESAALTDVEMESTTARPAMMETKSIKMRVPTTVRSLAVAMAFGVRTFYQASGALRPAMMGTKWMGTAVTTAAHNAAVETVLSLAKSNVTMVTKSKQTAV